MNFNKSGIVMASIGNINRGIYSIIDVADYKMWPKPSKLAFWVDWKMADIISPLPGCSKRKSGKSISVEEQQIILNVAKYFQEESKSGNKPQFIAGAVIAKTAAATGVSKNSVRKIVSAGKVIDEGKTRKAKEQVSAKIP